ncbi:MAG: hypothetical protein J6Q81_04640, partial [Lentisphaeria bacterium]|nr:hypothetical protein [Lentisphaeria bacterium]
MKKLFVSIAALFFAAAACAVASSVIAEWDFSKPGCLKGKYQLVLRGKTKLENNALILLNETLNQPGGALVKNANPALTPANAFKIEAVIELDKKFKRAQNWIMIYDSKYVVMPSSEAHKKLYNCGFMFYLQPRGQNRYRMAAAFGYGNSSAAAFSKDFSLQYGTEAALAMHFNAVGKVMFYCNGKLLSSTNVPAGTLAPAARNPVLGDRMGPNYASLGGKLKKLTISNIAYQQAAFTSNPAKRRVFERGEKDCKLYIRLNNRSAAVLNNIQIDITGNGDNKIVRKNVSIQPHSFYEVTLPVDSTLLPGSYQCKLTALDSAGKIIARNSVEYFIAAAYGDFMPVILWGTLYKPSVLKKYGFTHEILHFFPRQGDYKSQSLPGHITLLDDYLKNNFYSVGSLHGHYRFLQANRFLRTDRKGKVYPRKNLEASNPEVQKEFASAAFTTAKNLADHPAFDGCLINSEVRDGALPSFGSGIEPTAFKKFAGYDIPLTVNGKTPQDHLPNKKFPWDGVIADNTPDLHFIRWFWQQGDGWNPLQTLLSQALHRAVDKYEHKKRFFTFYDPVTRTPPLWGSGGNVDMISQWTYTYPDPIIIGQTTDEVIAMAQGNPRQKIASMTQAIWYRSQTAPVNVKVKNPPDWLNYEPKATFLSIAPDSLREALWVKISRRLDAIMYHGVGSLIERTDHWGYRFTNVRSRDVLKELCDTVIKPLGPVLKRVPERPMEIAILESFASSQYLAKHFPLGWGRG